MKSSLICLLALVCPVLTISSANAAGEEDRVSAVIVLQDADVVSLKQTGFIKMAIPPAMIDRVDSVTLKRPIRFKDEAAVLFSDVDRRNAMVSVRIDDATMEQIDYQPVELKIFESGFSSIVVQYRPGNSKPAQKSSKDDSGIFVTQLNNSKSLTGRFAGMKEFAIKSELGEIDVVLEDVSQITFEDDDRATVQMNNGDQLSGEIDFRNITINSRWGLEDLKVSEIAIISRSIDNSIAESSINAMAFATPMSLPQSVPVPQVSIPQPMMAMPGDWQDYSYSYPNNQRIDTVPGSLGEAYDTYANQNAFDQSMDQLMQPMEMMPMEMMPMDQSFGPFFGDPVPIGEPLPIGEPMILDEQPVGGFGEMIQTQQEIPLPQNGSPSNENDFWFFPQ